MSQITPFEFATATRILFGAGTVAQIGSIAAELGSHALVVVGASTKRVDPLLNILTAHQIAYATFNVPGEPTIELVQQGTEQARRAQCDLVIGIGGGSVIDAGKAIAALLTNDGDPLDYLEVIGRGQPLTQPSAPYVAIPTTAGTGAEVTRNAVLSSPKHQVKVSLRSPHMLPRVALVDPGLTHSMPPTITATTGLDALTQLIEPYVSINANPLTDALCVEGMGRAARALRQACANGDDGAAREEMALASLLGGLALANAKLGAVHGFAGVFGGMFDAPHGGICAALLPHVMAVNLNALTARQPNREFLHRYTRIAQILTGDSAATAKDGVAWVARLVRDLQIPTLSEYGLTAERTAELIEKSSNSSSMKGNPIKLTAAELAAIVERAK